MTEILSDADIAKEPEVLNTPMKDAFDWSDSKVDVRDAIWDHIMESNNHSTDKTAEAMKPFLDMSEDEVKDYVEKILKK